MARFSQIKDAMVFAFNLPAIVELGTATGFDFQLIDQWRSGHAEKLTQARNQLFGEVAKHLISLLACVRPNGLEDTPQFKVDIDQEQKAQALGVSISDINTTLGAAWGGSYVNDFTDRGRVKKVYVMSEAKATVCCRKILWQPVAFAVAMDRWCRSQPSPPHTGVWFAASGTL